MIYYFATVFKMLYLKHQYVIQNSTFIGELWSIIKQNPHLKNMKIMSTTEATCMSAFIFLLVLPQCVAILNSVFFSLEFKSYFLFLRPTTTSFSCCGILVSLDTSYGNFTCHVFLPQGILTILMFLLFCIQVRISL